MEHAINNPKQAEHGRDVVAARRPTLEPAPHPALQLQQKVGNQAMQQLLRSGVIRAKLSISQPDDPEEREADSIADHIMRSPAGAAAAAAPCSCSEGEETCDECRADGAVARKASGGGPGPDWGRRSGSGVGRPAALPHPDRAIRSILQSPGRGLDAPARAFFEPRFGHDFSRVRIHTDASADASAQSIHALAYTAGDHVVFRAGEYSPDTEQGRSLLAHELAHVVAGTGGIQRQADPNATVDVDVVPESPAETERLKASGVNEPQVSQATTAAVGGSPYSILIPGYQQKGDSCGAASLVSALLIWDREHWDPAHPNSRAVDASDLIILQLERHGDEAAERWATAKPAPGCAAGDHPCSVKAWTDLRDYFIGNLATTRNTARAPGGVVSEADYQQFGLALYFLWNQGHGSGIGNAEIDRIQQSLGLYTGTSTNIRDFNAIFTNDIVTSLAPDQIAQVFWFVVSGQQHAFLIGRLSTGKWFLSDQGQPAQFQADSLADLHSIVAIAASTGASWLYSGSTEEYIRKTNILPGYVGIQKLASSEGTHDAVQKTIPSGTDLCEVDAGYFTFGSTVTSGAFISRQYSLADAQAALPGGSGGGVIVELPAGVFSVYVTSTVSDANLDEKSIDNSDSSKMLLGGAHAFHQAWLILGNRFGVRRSWFRVY